jgi:hypothetical protein
VTLRGTDGETRVLPLSELQSELEASGLGSLVMQRLPEDAEPLETRTEVEEDVELTQVIDSIAEDDAPPAGATATTNEGEASSPMASTGAPDTTRKPHRRRGRRGGRRNRAGRERGDTGGTGSDSSGA